MILDTVQLIHNMSINPIIKFGTARYNIYMCIARGQPCFATSPNWRQMWLAPWPLSFQCNLFTYFSIWYGQVLLQSNPVILRRKFRWVHIFEDGIQGYHIKYTYNVTICIASVLLWAFFFERDRCEWGYCLCLQRMPFTTKNRFTAQKWAKEEGYYNKSDQDERDLWLALNTFMVPEISSGILPSKGSGI